MMQDKRKEKYAKLSREQDSAFKGIVGSLCVFLGAQIVVLIILILRECGGSS